MKSYIAHANRTSVMFSVTKMIKFHLKNNDDPHANIKISKMISPLISLQTILLSTITFPYLPYFSRYSPR